MIERTATWGDVAEGATILSPSDAPLAIIKTARTRKGLWYLAQDVHRRQFNISPKPSEAPVTLLECTPEEAELIAVHGLRAEHIMDLERESRMAERAKRWIVPPLPTKGRGVLDRVRDHLSWYHAVYTTDIKTLKQAREAHDEMHTEPLLMDRPHTHKEESV